MSAKFAFLFLSLLAPAIASAADADQPVAEGDNAAPTSTYAFGAGMVRLPQYIGAGSKRNFAVPYININWQDRVTFSTADGLIVDLINHGPWHGGVVGTMMWGRTRDELGALADKVQPLRNTLQGGIYGEYAVTKELSVGLRLRRDLESTGSVYGDVYADLDLPTPGLLEHSVKVAAETMNRSAMQRYFGVPDASAAALGISAYQPKGGFSQFAVTYSAFMPTSQSTGMALEAEFGRLVRRAADSPLVHDFGNANQRTLMTAFLYHF